jgi:hypothetical protein
MLLRLAGLEHSQHWGASSSCLRGDLDLDTIKRKFPPFYTRERVYTPMHATKGKKANAFFNKGLHCRVRLPDVPSRARCGVKPFAFLGRARFYPLSRESFDGLARLFFFSFPGDKGA